VRQEVERLLYRGDPLLLQGFGQLRPHSLDELDGGLQVFAVDGLLQGRLGRRDLAHRREDEPPLAVDLHGETVARLQAELLHQFSGDGEDIVVGERDNGHGMGAGACTGREIVPSMRRFVNIAMRGRADGAHVAERQKLIHIRFRVGMLCNNL